jgi:hypothetical protein
MKTKNLLLIIAPLAMCGNADAQFLKKLSEKAGKAVDGIFGPDSTEVDGHESRLNAVDYNTAKNINTENKRAFYIHDLVIHTVNEKNENTDTYFDAEEIASKMTSSTSESPLYVDSEGFQYAYNEGEARWKKTGIMRTDAMSFAMPMMSMSMLKLPPEPILDASEDFKEKGMNMNTFMMVEWVFIYSPDDFRMDGYTEKKEPCENGSSCATFYYEDPEYKGSYVQFDSNGRLSKIVADANGQYAQGSGTFEFDYDTPVSVSIPSATEVKMPFQDLFIEGLNVNDEK